MDYITNGIMLALSLVCAVVLYKQQRTGDLLDGIKAGLGMFMEMLPVFAASFLIAGIALAMISPEQLSLWLSGSNNVAGSMIAALVGAVAPTSPIVLYPIAGTLNSVGTPVAVVIAFVAGFSLVGIGRAIVFELPFMGLKYVIIRSSVALLMPVIIGLIVQSLYVG
ncbi:hypothetical protein [Endozoicomonas sp.]|uniref:hypothetical protein n=1 Tax=Endozoicomonas sp. TaxID=1892382 RepID=UPI002883681F|nr:hypothetical protein [Endozoicomonas sp.]